MSATTIRQRNREARAEEADARGIALRESFTARIKAQDPNDPLTHDPYWNPKHPDYDPDPYVEGLGGGGSVIVEPDRSRAQQGPESSRSDGYPPARGRDDSASPKQIAWIRQMLANTRITDDDIVNRGKAMLEEDGTLTKQWARDVIDILKLEPRRNERPGQCDNCGGHVPAQEGALAKVRGYWIVTHYRQCPEVPEVAPGPPTGGLDLRTLGTGSHRFGIPGSDSRLKVRIDVAKGGKWDGWVFVKDAAEYGTGNRYGKQRPGGTYDGDIKDELAAILENVDGARARYGELTGNCSACNRHLEDDESIRLGIGPVCRTKGR